MVQSVESARQGKLQFTRDGQDLVITLPLDDADLIVYRKSHEAARGGNVQKPNL